jgi:hypothetical protein
MPVTLSYPGVYIEEVPSGVRTIVGVATSITAFVGRALRGPVNQPVRVQSFAEFERIFGGLWTSSGLSYAVQHFFLNGGGDALIVRVVHTGDATPPTMPSRLPAPPAGWMWPQLMRECGATVSASWWIMPRATLPIRRCST